MWLQPSPWPDSTRLCSDDEHGCEKWLTEAPGARYAQIRAKYSFFKTGSGSRVPRRITRDNAAAFWVRKGRRVTDQDPENLQNGKPAP